MLEYSNNKFIMLFAEISATKYILVGLRGYFTTTTKEHFI